MRVLWVVRRPRRRSPASPVEKTGRKGVILPDNTAPLLLQQSAAVPAGTANPIMFPFETREGATKHIFEATQNHMVLEPSVLGVCFKRE